VVVGQEVDRVGLAHRLRRRVLDCLFRRRRVRRAALARGAGLGRRGVVRFIAGDAEPALPRADRDFRAPDADDLPAPDAFFAAVFFADRFAPAPLPALLPARLAAPLASIALRSGEARSDFAYATSYGSLMLRRLRSVVRPRVLLSAIEILLEIRRIADRCVGAAAPARTIGVKTRARQRRAPPARAGARLIGLQENAYATPHDARRVRGQRDVVAGSLACISVRAGLASAVLPTAAPSTRLLGRRATPRISCAGRGKPERAL